MNVEQASESGNYEYVTARVRSRRSVLFDDDDYRKLIRMGTGEIARFMEESEYETEMNALGARHSGVDLVEFALNRNVAKHFDDLLRWSEGRLYDLIVRYLRKFDAWNVKTVIRGLYADGEREEIEADLIRAGEFDDDFLDQLLSAGSIEEVVELLDGTRFGDPLAEAYPVYEEEGVLNESFGDIDTRACRLGGSLQSVVSGNRRHLLGAFFVVDGASFTSEVEPSSLPVLSSFFRAFGGVVHRVCEFLHTRVKCFA